MSTYTRAKTRRQQRHPASRSRSHKADKAAAERRKAVAFLPIPAPNYAVAGPTLEGLGMTGYELIYDGSRWHACADPESFGDYLEGESKRRNWFFDLVQRGRKRARMRRKVATPIEVLTTPFCAGMRTWCASELEHGADPRWHLAAIRNWWLQTVVPVLQSQRYIIGVAAHFDTPTPHFDVVVSRQDGCGGRIGQAGLGLVGPWVVSVDRQVRFGAAISQIKREKLDKDFANFGYRYGPDSIPLDVRMARALDAVSRDIVGPHLDQHRSAYAAQVPLLEQAHILAKIEALEGAREHLIRQLDAVPKRPLLARDMEPDRNR